MLTDAGTSPQYVKSGRAVGSPTARPRHSHSTYLSAQRIHAAMPKHLADLTQRRALTEQIRGEAVKQEVCSSDQRLKPGAVKRPPDKSLSPSWDPQSPARARCHTGRRSATRVEVDRGARTRPAPHRLRSVTAGDP